MKKDCFIHACTREKLKKLLLVMKLSSLLMLLFCMNLSAGIHAQEAKFSVAVENGNIREIIRIIKNNLAAAAPIECERVLVRPGFVIRKSTASGSRENNMEGERKSCGGK